MKPKTWAFLVLVLLLMALLMCWWTFFPEAALSGDVTYIAASILRGEAPRDCVRCREMTACALVRDMRRGVNLRARWYGWSAARDEDVAMIRRAEDPQFCKQYPECRFTGNGRDLEVWSRKGWVASDARVVAYCSGHGCSVCVPVVHATIEAK
ncbi:MAG: hypothetical protein JXR84_15205 [Anaerolineae bacterium]|nr:hypothetical protein [Anaerolineae bacterium]